MLALLVQHEPDRPLTHIRRKLLLRLARREPFLSGVRAPAIPGQFTPEIALEQI
jgi:hypothetical protein